jgi:hypothetical protein
LGCVLKTKNISVPYVAIIMMGLCIVSAVDDPHVDKLGEHHAGSDVPLPLLEAVDRVLANVEAWQFNAFELQEATQVGP